MNLSIKSSVDSDNINKLDYMMNIKRWYLLRSIIVWPMAVLTL